MKKLLMVIVALAMTLTASAQFEEGKWYVGASTTGIDLNYNSAQKVRLALNAKGGYLIQDNWMITGGVGYDHSEDADIFTLSAGGRYYIIQNGLYLGLEARYKHISPSYNDLKPTAEIGYSFFVTHYLTIEPTIFYEQSLKSHASYSSVGASIGFGIYF